MSGQTLHLTLKRQWFDMIASGEKTDEYREIKPYWETRLSDASRYSVVRFRNGYNPGSPTMTIELLGISQGVGNPKWGAPSSPVYRLHLGKIIEQPSA